MEKSAYGAFLVEAMLAGKGWRVDSAKFAVLALRDCSPDRVDCLWIDIGRLPQKREQILSFMGGGGGGECAPAACSPDRSLIRVFYFTAKRAIWPFE